MTTALLEIGTEHLPARFVKPALRQLEDNAQKLLSEKRIAFESVRTCGTHRRLALFIDGLADSSPDAEKVALGPSVSKWKDANGKFTPQSEGFARAQGVAPDKLYPVQSPKGEVLAAKKIIKGESARQILSEIFPKLIAGLQFPKNMVWEESQFRFARPIRSLAGLLGKDVVKFEIAGVKSSNKISGQTGGKPVKLSAPEEYLPSLEKETVVCEPEKRRAQITAAVREQAALCGAEPALDEDLLEETVYLAENPMPQHGGFDKRFMKLPPELITTVLKKQLKFFPTVNPQGELTHNFIAVCDGAHGNVAEVRAGFEAVVEARLSDAMFFFEKDLTRPPDDMRGKLGEILFHEKLGSMYQKSARVEHLARWICERIRQDIHLDEFAVLQAAKFAYADLASEVVREFPELQGSMGGEYAARAGEQSRAALAIKEFYFPLTAKSQLPTTLEGAIVSLAGKMDTLVGDFAVGMEPTGSEDPHGLRRQAAGLVRIMMEKGLPLSACEIAGHAFSLLPDDFKSGELTRRVNLLRRQLSDKEPEPLLPDRDKILRAAEEFIWQRAETILAEKGFGPDEIRAVRQAQFRGGELAKPMSFGEVFARVCALHNMRKDADFEAVAVSFKRVANITRKADAERTPSPAAAGAQSAQTGPAQADRALFSTAAENDLYAAMKAVRAKTDLHLSGPRATQLDYEYCLKEMVSLKPQIDGFFTSVMVMDNDPKIRANRLALLGELYEMLASVADISQLQQ
ncbi:MAG: glycine--tRNA ligase subunit beta [Elusimicrobiales bacterium]